MLMVNGEVVNGDKTWRLRLRWSVFRCSNTKYPFYYNIHLFGAIKTARLESRVSASSSMAVVSEPT